MLNDWSERNKVDNRLMESTKKRSSLPIFAMKNEIMEAIHNNPIVLIRGNTGCGKTTQVIKRTTVCVCVWGGGGRGTVIWIK